MVLEDIYSIQVGLNLYDTILSEGKINNNNTISSASVSVCYTRAGTTIDEEVKPSAKIGRACLLERDRVRYVRRGHGFAGYRSCVISPVFRRGPQTVDADWLMAGL